MNRYDPIEIYAFWCLCAVFVMAVVALIVLQIRERIEMRREREAKRAKYIETLEKQRNFYRLQCQTRGISEEYEQAVAFERLRRGSEKR